MRSWLAGLEREAVSPNTVAKAYRLLARIMDTAVEAGLLVRNPCAVRHTSATLSIAAGASTRELMARLGHSSSAAALRYQHVMAGRDAAIAAALDELIEAASALAEAPPSASSGTRMARIGQPGSGKKRR